MSADSKHHIEKSLDTEQDEALGMTVYNLSNQSSSPEIEALSPQRRRYGRIKMLLLLLVCAAPIIASYFTYYVIRPDCKA